MVRIFYTNIVKDGAIAAGLCPKIAEPHPVFCKYNGFLFDFTAQRIFQSVISRNIGLNAADADR